MKLIVLTKRKFVKFAIAAVVVGWLVVVAWPATPPPPPGLTFVSAEAIELKDESGAALWLVTFTVNFDPSTTVIKDVGKVIETQKGDNPRNGRGIMAGSSSSKTQAQCLCLVPAGTTSCRISMKYARPVVPVYSRAISYMLRRLPFRIPGIDPVLRRKWYYAEPVPDKWRKITLEMPLPGNVD